MSNTLKQKVVKGAIWTVLEKLSTQIVGFIVGMVLARLLTPTDYGTVAITSIFFAVTGVLVDGGFGGALIQKKDADDLDFNSVFYLSVLISILAYAGLYFAAPWIADFYKTPILKSLVRVSSITFLFNAVNAIQNAELTKKMLFHLSFRISLITCFTSAVCGITLAFLGYGVWALVWTSLISGLVGVIARWFIIAWRPRLMFSWKRLLPLFSYGWRMTVAGLIGSFFSNLNGILIGRFYTKADLAFVNKGSALPELAMTQVNGTLERVSFPALVMVQNDLHSLREAMRKMMVCSSFLVFPMMVGVAICAPTELRLLYGEQWVPAAPYMQLACFTFALWPFHTINLRGIMALGRSDIFLKLEIIKKVLYVLCILAFFRYGVFTFMAVSAFALGPLGVIINAWPNRKLLDYTLGMQLRDVFPSAAICFVMAIVVMGVGFVMNLASSYFDLSDKLGMCLFLVSKLLLQILTGAVVYFSLSYVFKLKPMMEYLSVMEKIPFVKRKRGILK